MRLLVCRRDSRTRSIHHRDQSEDLPARRKVLVQCEKRPHSSLLFEAEAGVETRSLLHNDAFHVEKRFLFTDPNLLNLGGNVAARRPSVRGGQRGQPGRSGATAALHALSLFELVFAHVLHALLHFGYGKVALHRLHRDSGGRRGYG